MSARKGVPASAREKLREVLRVLREEFAVEKTTIARDSHNHLVVSFTVDGLPGTLTLPGTPGDRFRQRQQARGLARGAVRRAKRGPPCRPTG